MSSLRTKQINPFLSLCLTAVRSIISVAGRFAQQGWRAVGEIYPSPNVVRAPVGLKYCRVGGLWVIPLTNLYFYPEHTQEWGGPCRDGEGNPMATLPHWIAASKAHRQIKAAWLPGRTSPVDNGESGPRPRPPRPLA